MAPLTTVSRGAVVSWARDGGHRDDLRRRRPGNSGRVWRRVRVDGDGVRGKGRLQRHRWGDPRRARWRGRVARSLLVARTPPPGAPRLGLGGRVLLISVRIRGRPSHDLAASRRHHQARKSTSLATDRHVSSSTQNQALAAILFLYKDVLRVELPWLGD